MQMLENDQPILNSLQEQCANMSLEDILKKSSEIGEEILHELKPRETLLFLCQTLIQRASNLDECNEVKKLNLTITLKHLESLCLSGAEVDKAIAIQKEILSYKQKIMDKQTLITTYNTLSTLLINEYSKDNAKHNNLKEVEGYLKLALELIGSNSKHNELCDILRNYSFLHQILENYDLALDFQQKSLVAYESVGTGFSLLLLNIYFSFGIIYSGKNDFVKAGEYFQKILSLQSKIKNPNHWLITETYYNLGSISHKLCKYEEAQTLLEKFISIKVEKKEFDLKLYKGYYEFAYSNFKLQDYPLAVEYFKKSLELAENLFPIENTERNLKVYTCKLKIGDCYHKAGNDPVLLETALQWYEEACKATKAFQGETAYALCLQRMACSQEKLNDYNHALKSALNAISIFTRISFKRTYVQNDKSLMNSYINCLSVHKVIQHKTDNYSGALKTELNIFKYIKKDPANQEFIQRHSNEIKNLEKNILKKNRNLEFNI